MGHVHQIFPSVIGRISGMNSREIGRMRARQSLMKIGNILSNVKMVVNMEEVKREKKKMMVLLLEMLLKRKKKRRGKKKRKCCAECWRSCHDGDYARCRRGPSIDCLICSLDNKSALYWIGSGTLLFDTYFTP